jgi:hypothetical protein
MINAAPIGLVPDLAILAGLYRGPGNKVAPLSNFPGADLGMLVLHASTGPLKVAQIGVRMAFALGVIPVIPKVGADKGKILASRDAPRAIFV